MINVYLARRDVDIYIQMLKNILAKITLRRNHSVHKPNNNPLSLSLSSKIMLGSGILTTVYTLSYITDETTKLGHTTQKYVDDIRAFRKRYCKSASLLGSVMLSILFPHFGKNNSTK